MELMFGTDKIVDVENVDFFFFFGNYEGKSGLGASTGEAAGPEMPPSLGWECLVSLFHLWRCSLLTCTVCSRCFGLQRAPCGFPAFGNVVLVMFG